LVTVLELFRITAVNLEFGLKVVADAAASAEGKRNYPIPRLEESYNPVIVGVILKKMAPQ
jgi:hypothetical protein